MEENKYQAIVIGGGMSGSWAVKELCDAGIKTLLLERGPDVVHLRDYPTAAKFPWELEHRNQVDHKVREENPSISRCYAYGEATEHFFVKDTDHPYIQEKPFDWIRGYQMGGKSLMWARMTQRWSEYDFEGPKRDGFAVDWPIRYADIAPWYDKVEHFVGISGEKDGLDSLPDGDFLRPLGMSCTQEYFRDFVKDNYDDRHVIQSRCAHLTEVRDIHKQQGRGQCQHRLLCERGCPFGGYFSAVSSTIPWAKRTGNLTIRPHSVVHSILYDDASGKATGVKVIDANSKEELVFAAPIIFLNAGAINSNMILLNSKSDRFPEGLGNDSGTLGKYVAFHNYRVTVTARVNDFLDKREDGRSPSGAYMPRFVNLEKQDITKNYKRGYAVNVFSYRPMKTNTDGIGQELLDNILQKDTFEPWVIGAQMMGETIPKESNYVKLDETQKDEWGMPLVRINVDYDENDENMIQDFFETFSKMFEKAGFTDISQNDDHRAPGLDIHEMGGVRMGRDPETSMLNAHHQLHAVPNVYVTDGACMTSTSTQNPSLTYMAFAARAANHAIENLES